MCPEFAKKLYNRGKDEFAAVNLDKAPTAFDECGYIHLTEDDEGNEDESEVPFPSGLFDSASAMFSDYGFLPPHLRGMNIEVVVASEEEALAKTCFASAHAIVYAASVASLAFALLQ